MGITSVFPETVGKEGRGDDRESNRQRERERRDPETERDISFPSMPIANGVLWEALLSLFSNVTDFLNQKLLSRHLGAGHLCCP